jgi:hypothetical protein
MKRWFWLPVLIILIGAIPAGADDFTGILDKAAQFNKGNKPLDSVATLRQAITHVWNRMPMTIKKAALVTAGAPAYGLYEDRPDNIFKSGDKVFIYAEPVGYRFAQANKGYNFRIACDLAILSKEGKVLGGQSDFGKWTMRCGEPMFEFYINMTITLTEFPPGEYTLVMTFRDLNGEGQTSVKQPIVVQ